jgi:glycosyltransferase involved in cell wall biosynthesis
LFIPEILLRRQHQKVVSNLRQSNIKVVFFVHDLIPLMASSFAPTEILFAFKNYLKITSFALRIYVPSNQVQRELNEYYESLKKKNRNDSKEIYLAQPRPRTRVDPTSECIRLEFNGETLVYVSSFIKRKNQLGAIRAISDYAVKTKSAWRLVLVGSNGNMYNILLFFAKKYQNPYFETVILRDIHECCLSSIYRSSTAALYLSLSEGYGMPVQDAIQEGLWVVTSKVPAIDDENLLCGSLLVDPRDEKAIQLAVREIAKGKVQCASIREVNPTSVWPALSEF